MTPIEPSYTSGEFESEHLMKEIQNAITDYEQRLQNLELDADTLANSEAVEKYAHLEAYNKVAELAFEYLNAELTQATADTGEYNIPIFTSHMENALAEHRNNLIEIDDDDGNPGYIDVRINMELLGTAEQYVTAVKTARGELGLGKITDAKVRSKIWREIYQIDRESGTKIHPTSEEDVTERYVGKYFATIAERLKSIDPTSAPWWYYINFGNKTVEAQESAATPYPEFSPTNFVIKTELAINSAFDDIFIGILDEAEKVYSDLLRKDYGIEGVTPGIRDVLSDASAISFDEIFEKSKEAITHKTIEIVEYNNLQWDIYVTSTGKIGRRYSLAKNR